jgi:hypothetical protein
MSKHHDAESTQLHAILARWLLLCHQNMSLVCLLLHSTGILQILKLCRVLNGQAAPQDALQGRRTLGSLYRTVERYRDAELCTRFRA